jgi:hypothetical protein
MLNKEQLVQLCQVATANKTCKAAWMENAKKNTGAIPPVTGTYWEAW